jgi:uncharacterized membrane protein (UPF0127 family)
VIVGMLKGRVEFVSPAGYSRKVSLSVRKTESAIERTRGLLGAEQLGELEGLWIKPCNSIHSFGMRYPLDVIYLDRHDRVTSLRRHLKPMRMSLDLWARSVIELNVGVIDRLELQKGDVLNWSEYA